MSEWKFSDSKTNWGGIMAKAQRLRLDGGVNVEKKEDGYVSGIVQGDHGTYEVQMVSHDPASGIIDEWSCQCPWFQYAFDRTEKYQKYEGRFCSHALALYWQSQTEEPTKTPEEAAPEEERDEKPVVEQERMWEMEQPEEAEEIAIEEPERLAPPEIEGPKVISEVAPPTEPQVEEPYVVEPQVEEPLVPEEFEWKEEPEEQFFSENPRNAKVATTKNMKHIKTIKDFLFYKAATNGNINGRI